MRVETIQEYQQCLVQAIDVLLRPNSKVKKYITKTILLEPSRREKHFFLILKQVLSSKMNEYCPILCCSNRLVQANPKRKCEQITKVTKLS